MREYLVHRTPENVSFEHELASLPSRAVAWSVDLVVLGVLTVIAGMGLSLLGTVGVAAFSVVFFLLFWWYGALVEWAFAGRTFGKLLVGLRTLDERGLRITFFQATVRNLVRIVDVLPFFYLVGGVSALLDPRCRRLGDFAAATIVVVERRPVRPASVLPPSERHNTFADDPAVLLAARRITPPERDIMLALALRRDQLPLAVRQALFGRLADHLAARLRLERPAFFSPEKFVLQLTAALLSVGRSAPLRATG